MLQPEWSHQSATLMVPPPLRETLQQLRTALSLKTRLYNTPLTASHAMVSLVLCSLILSPMSSILSLLGLEGSSFSFSYTPYFFLLLGFCMECPFSPPHLVNRDLSLPITIQIHCHREAFCGLSGPQSPSDFFSWELLHLLSCFVLFFICSYFINVYFLR